MWQGSEESMRGEWVNWKDRVEIGLPIADHEVPNLCEAVGWERRDGDYPATFRDSLFWAGCRDDSGRLIGFVCITGPGLPQQHGYLENTLVHPAYQRRGIGTALVRRALEEAERYGLDLVTTTFAEEHTGFYEGCGFELCPGGEWRPPDKRQ
jgi:GNAT superfamily N-acetyltransferase